MLRAIDARRGDRFVELPERRGVRVVRGLHVFERRLQDAFDLRLLRIGSADLRQHGLHVLEMVFGSAA